MLVLTRKAGEEIVIDGEITVRVIQTAGGRVRLAIDAPRHVQIMRAELLNAFQAEDSEQSRTREVVHN